MLENILESKTQSNLLAFFLVNTERSLFIGEIEKRVGGKGLLSNLKVLQKKGILQGYSQHGKRYYQINRTFPGYSQMRNSILRNFNKYEDELIKELKKLKGLRYAVLTGIFTGESHLECDILLVGELVNNQIDKFIFGAENIMGQEVNFAVMDEREFNYRKDTFDRFMKDIYENKHLVVFNKIKA